MDNVLVKLKETFGEDVVMLNAQDKASEYFFNNDVLREVDRPKVDHLLKFANMGILGALVISNQATGELTNLNSDKLGEFINEFYKLLFSCDNMFSNDKFVVDTENVEINDPTIADYFIKGVRNIMPIIENKSTNEDIEDIINNKLDEDSIMLLWGLFNGTDDKTYTDDKREDVLIHATTFPDSKVRKIIDDVYLSPGKSSMEFDEMLKTIGLNEAKKLLKNGIRLYESNGSITALSFKNNKITKLKY